MFEFIRQIFAPKDTTNSESVLVVMTQASKEDKAVLHIVVHSDKETILKLKSSLNYYCHRIIANKNIIITDEGKFDVAGDVANGDVIKFYKKS